MAIREWHEAVLGRAEQFAPANAAFSAEKSGRFRGFGRYAPSGVLSDVHLHSIGTRTFWPYLLLLREIGEPGALAPGCCAWHCLREAVSGIAGG